LPSANAWVYDHSVFPGTDLALAGEKKWLQTQDVEAVCDIAIIVCPGIGQLV
jgi:hypothetical protein